MTEPLPARIVGEVATRARVVVAEPYFEPGPAVTLGHRAVVDAAAGDLVSVVPDGRGRGRLDRVLGRPDDPAAVMLALAVEAGAADPWPAGPPLRRDSPPAGDRLDLRGLATLTIDPEGAKDHDDALSVDGDRVYVHIADVSAHVPAGSGLDAEAARRATSVYLPGRVDPMLPGRALVRPLQPSGREPTGSRSASRSARRVRSPCTAR